MPLTDAPRLLRRLPIRVRLTVAFSGVMAAVLAGAGVFLYLQVRSDLDAQIDAALRLQASNIVTLVHTGRAQTIRASGKGLGQVYGHGRRLLYSTGAAAGSRLLTPAQVGRALGRPLLIEHRALGAGSARVFAVPVRALGQTVVVAVATSLRLRNHEISHLGTLLLIAGPLALLLASIAGYELASAALHSVDRMRARAERITEQKLSERLPVPEADDEISALGRTLNSMLDRVEFAVARERRVVSDASHELRTPLTTLRAEIDLALMGEREPAELRAALESAADETRRMSRLADDLLVLARADQGNLPLNPRPLSACELLQEAARRARAAAELRGHAIVVGPCDEAWVRADPDRAAQALRNLLTNALRYGSGTITLNAQEAGDMVELHVRDRGPGFPHDFLARAFERFARGDQARASGHGSGLGLALVQAVALAHGGQAGARNRARGGADVWIALPRA